MIFLWILDYAYIDINCFQNFMFILVSIWNYILPFCSTNPSVNTGIHSEGRSLCFLKYNFYNDKYIIVSLILENIIVFFLTVIYDRLMCDQKRIINILFKIDLFMTMSPVACLINLEYFNYQDPTLSKL